MENQFSRTELLMGASALATLRNSHVIVFGVGGVGGYVVEVLARSGVGNIDVVDDDFVTLSNINRQIIATHSSLGKPKRRCRRGSHQGYKPRMQGWQVPNFLSARNSQSVRLLKL